MRKILLINHKFYKISFQPKPAYMARGSIVGLLDLVDGDILYSEAVEFIWEWNELVTEQRYKYDSFDWTDDDGNPPKEGDYYYKKTDLQFIEDARKAIKEGKKVYYNSWW